MKFTLPLFIALLLSNARAKELAIEMPTFTVHGPKFVRYTVSQEGSGDVLRLHLKEIPLSEGVITIWVGGGQPRDEVVQINGKEVAALKKKEWMRELYGYFKLVLKRPIGRSSFTLIEVDGQCAPPTGQ